MKSFGADLSIFLGAAGVLTVALGFASRTAASNLISGLFLVGEKALSVGDSVQVGTISGQVVAVDHRGGGRGRQVRGDSQGDHRQPRVGHDRRYSSRGRSYGPRWIYRPWFGRHVQRHVQRHVHGRSCHH